MADEELVINWDAVFPRPKKKKGPVRPPDTSRRVMVEGRTYPSLTAAAAAMGISTTKIYSLAKQGRADLGEKACVG